MPGLEDLRSTSIAGLNDIKCQFAYGTDYWAARQEVINRIGSVDNLPPGVTPGLSPWSPTGEIVRYVLESPDGPAYTTNQLKAVQDWVLNRALKQVPGVIDVTGYGGDGQAVSGPARHPADEAVQRHAPAGRGRDQELQRQRRRRHPDAGRPGPQRPRHRPARRGASTRSTRPTSTSRRGSRPTSSDDIQDVVVAPTTARRSSSSRSPSASSATARGSADRSAGPRRCDGAKSGRDDVVEGIVLMRKYEKSLPTAEAVEEKIKEIERIAPPAQGDADPGLQPADRPGPRDDAQRPAQPRRRHGAGGRSSCSSSWATWSAPGSWRS